ncbi:ulp-1 [Ecytonucleospora hepatopenaei]|uniref:Ulp-1 n=1 Tax=Ecytonucleospora hepatopenaei TaxID=646526 RepID=A0A1W0E7D8_9MICR|nr:ulp-1 [Ecytonucleospora hepatopenaei]
MVFQYNKNKEETKQEGSTDKKTFHIKLDPNKFNNSLRIKESSEEVIEIESSSDSLNSKTNLKNNERKFHINTYEKPCCKKYKGRHSYENFSHVIFLLKKDKCLCMNTFLYKEDLRRLKPGKWFNDKLINVYFSILGKLNPSFKMLTTFFIETIFSEKSQESQKQIVSLKYRNCRMDWKTKQHILLPLHMGAHWILIHYDFININIYDSYVQPIYYYTLNKKIIKIVKLFEEILGTKIQIRLQNRIQQQTNGNDCGVFVCMFGWKLVKKFDVFSKIEMKYFRDMIACDIIQNIS